MTADYADSCPLFLCWQVYIVAATLPRPYDNSSEPYFIRFKRSLVDVSELDGSHGATEPYSLN